MTNIVGKDAIHWQYTEAYIRNVGVARFYRDSDMEWRRYLDCDAQSVNLANALCSTKISEPGLYHPGIIPSASYTVLEKFAITSCGMKKIPMPEEISSIIRDHDRSGGLY